MVFEQSPHRDATDVELKRAFPAVATLLPALGMDPGGARGAGHPAGAEERDTPAGITVTWDTSASSWEHASLSLLFSDGAPSLDCSPVRTGPCRPAVVLTVSLQLGPAGPEPTLQTSLTSE